MILYFPRSLRSLPRKLHQQRRTIHHAKIDERKKSFLLNSFCYGQLTPQASVGKHAQYQPNKLAVSFPETRSQPAYDVSAALNVTPQRPVLT